MGLRMTNIGVTALGLVLAVHAVLALTKKRWVTFFLELVVTIVLFWLLWQLRQRPTSVAPQS